MSPRVAQVQHPHVDRWRKETLVVDHRIAYLDRCCQIHQHYQLSLLQYYQSLNQDDYP